MGAKFFKTVEINGICVPVIREKFVRIKQAEQMLDKFVKYCEEKPNNYNFLVITKTGIMGGHKTESAQPEVMFRNDFEVAEQVKTIFNEREKDNNKVS